MAVALMGMGGAQGVTVMLVEKAVAGAAAAAVEVLSGEVGGKVEPSRLRKECPWERGGFFEIFVFEMFFEF